MRVRKPVKIVRHYNAGFGPYREILERLELPPRGPRGSAVNRKRARLVQEALHKAKVLRHPSELKKK